MGHEGPLAAFLHEVAADLEVRLPLEARAVRVGGQACLAGRGREPVRQLAQVHAMRGPVGPDRQPQREGEAVRADEGQHRGLVAPSELVHACVPLGRAALRRGRWRLGLRGVMGPHLLEVRAVQGRVLREVAVAPDEHALRAHVDIDPRVVPAELPAQERGRVHLLRGRQLLAAFLPVALAVGVQVRVVDLCGPLHEHGTGCVDAGPGRVAEQQRDLRVALGVIGLLRVAEPGREVDRAGAGLVVRGHRPGDRLAREPSTVVYSVVMKRSKTCWTSGRQRVVIGANI